MVMRWSPGLYGQWREGRRFSQDEPQVRGGYVSAAYTSDSERGDPLFLRFTEEELLRLLGAFQARRERLQALADAARHRALVAEYGPYIA